MTNAHHTLTRFNRPDGLRDLIRATVPPEWRTGPILGIAPHTDVLVAKAVTDGSALELALRPGHGSRRVRLGLRRLIRHRTYRVTGAIAPTVVADESGEGIIEVDLEIALNADRR
ncbi:hypothetical protein AB0L97_06280 [Nocardia sp. NPDC051911]|uniref:hypothetical protein n=1 Tax=Nocardia sp. NPDC051911 TaxID=3154648 RepID=UPI003429D522